MKYPISGHVSDINGMDSMITALWSIANDTQRSLERQNR